MGWYNTGGWQSLGWGSAAGGGGPGGTPAAALIDSDGTGAFFASATSFSYTGVTVSSLTNGLLVIGLGVGAPSNTSTVSSVVWDATGANQSLTFIGTQETGGNLHVELWGLKNPTAGASKIITVTISSPTTLECGYATFQHINQTTAWQNFNSAQALSSSNPPNVAVTTAANHAVFGFISAGSSAANINTVGNTPIFTNNSHINAFGAQYAIASGASITISGTGSASDNWATVGVDLPNA